jgi:hypothetical protein
MGDFCVAGFHSHLPIQNGDKVIAIVCKHNNKEFSNTPCYLSGVLTPICMPVVGYMGDYGSIEECEYDEDETTRILKEVTGRKFFEISEELAKMSEYRYEHEKYPEFFNVFNQITHSDETTRYHMIYEHYDVYKEMASDWDSVKKSIESFIIPAKKILSENGFNLILNPFHDFMSAGLYSDMVECIGGRNKIHKVFDMLGGRNKIHKVFDVLGNVRELYNDCEKNEHFYPPFKLMWHYVNHDMASMSLYNAVQIDLEKSKDDITRFCSFIVHFDNTEYGHFYFSTSAGQSWHHNKEMWETRLNMLKVYEKLIKDKIEEKA